MSYAKCYNCGADKGLHHYETRQCPKNGIEEYRDGKTQQWEDTVFLDSKTERLRNAAPDLLEALGDSIFHLKELRDYWVREAQSYEKEQRQMCIDNARSVTSQIEKAEAAIKKATE